MCGRYLLDCSWRMGFTWTSEATRRPVAKPIFPSWREKGRPYESLQRASEADLGQFAIDLSLSRP